MTSYKNKVVWITGASSGLGESLAYKFSEMGAKLVLSARNEDALHQVKQKCGGDSLKHLVVPIDLGKPESIDEAFAAVQQQCKQIDVLIHSGGISQRSLALETDHSVDKELMQVNYFGAVQLTKMVLPGMLLRNSGQLVAITSLTGKFGTPMRSGYAASKHALHGFFDSLRAEVHDKGIRVTLLCPGFIHTNISINALVGDGSKQNKMDDAQANGMSVKEFAEKAFKAISNKKPEVLIGGKETLGVYIKRYFPSIFRRIIRKAKVT